MDETIETDARYLDDDTTCAICYAEFLDAEDLSIHITQIHLNETSVKRFCNLCHSIFPDVQDYVFHLKDHHIKSLRWCKYCTRVFFNSENLKEHEVKHGELDLKSCSQCQESFFNYDELEFHEYNSHKDHVLSAGIMLQECFPIFSVALHMNVRAFFAVPYTHGKYSCISCGLETSDIDIYLQHLKMKEKSLYACDLCCNVFEEKYKLERHIHNSCKNEDNHNIHLKESNKCEKLNDKLIKTRKPSLGTNSDPYKVLSLTSVTNNEVLIPDQRKTIPLLTCKFCYKQFVGKIALSKHIDRSHKESFHLYKYKCVLCEQLYKHPKILFTHYFSKHKALHPYTCKICNKKFRVRKSFTLHIKLDHKSVGFVEFDENYHVFFSDKKSDNPFTPQSLISKGDERKKSVEAASKSNDTPDIDLTHINSDFMNPSETECETDMDKTQKKVTVKHVKPKRTLTKRYKPKRTKQSKPICETEISSDDSDVPLINMIRKTTRSNKNNKIEPIKKFICPKCDKNCYTYQNYHHHLSLHTGCKLKRCIKCDKKFKTKDALQKHVENKHTSSKLTDTLKQLLERRKNPNQLPKDRKSISEGFRRTVHKVLYGNENNYSPAEIKPVDNGLSAKKFIESFIPEETTKDIKVTSSITLKEVWDFDSSFNPNTIKLTKFSPEPTIIKYRLRMPVKFKQDNGNNIKVSIKLVENELPTTKPLLTFTSEVNNTDHSYRDAYENDDCHDDREEIPEVAEEVMLNEVGREAEWKEHKSIETQNSIIIPNLPQNCADVRIGHLQAQAPYYKIVKMEDVLKTADQATKAVETTPKNITLPDGTKLVTVNPLAHLLGNTSVEELLKLNKKHYEPKKRDIRTAIEKAMKNGYKPKRQRRTIC